MVVTKGLDIHKGDVLVVDDTRMVQCLACVKYSSGGKMEFALLVDEARKRAHTAWKSTWVLHGEAQLLICAHHQIRAVSLFRVREQELDIIV
jgi:S-adenosylmethionine:tRNA-ribosyltransferase-isomerase (queuine synthetase)